MPKFLYENIYEELKKRILSNRYPPDTLLPSESILKKEFNVSQITVRRAIRELVLDGLVESRQGKGTYIHSPENKGVVIGLSNFTSDVAGGRLNIIRTLLTDEMIPAAEEIAKKLRVQAGALVRHLVRLDSMKGEPFSIDEVFIPLVWSEKIDAEIASSPLFMHLLQKAGHLTFRQTEYDIHVGKASEREYACLKIEPESPLLITDELVFDTSGMPVLLVVSKYPAYRCRLSGMVTLVQKKTGNGIIGE